MAAVTCIFLEHEMGKGLLLFASHHHVLEVVFEKVFKLTLVASLRSDILLFKNFQNQWGSH